MRKHSDAFPLVLLGAVLVLAALFKSIYEDALKGWANKHLEAWFGPGAGTELMARFVEIAPALGLATAVVWLLNRYIHREYSTRQLAFVRDLEPPDGDIGYYTAFVSVENTSPTIKLHDCRCEIIELRSGDGALIEKNIALRTRGQRNKEVQGRFNLDQGATKDLPIFEIDQSRDDGVTVVNANDWDITLEHGVYTASLRGYGDSGEADEITILLDSRDCDFRVVERRPTRPNAALRRIAKESVQPEIRLSASVSTSQEGLFPAKYIQVSVQAVGNLIGCQVMLIEVARMDGDEPRVVYNHPQNAGWSGTDERMIDINDDQEQRANLFSVSRHIQSEQYLLFPRTHHPDERLRLAISVPALYRLTIHASSKTSGPEKRYFMLHWSGSFDDVSLWELQS